MPGEIWFYHLTREPLEALLPVLARRVLERGWRAVVRCGSPERAEALSARLWTFEDAAFLPHGTPADGRAEAQPILLTAGPEAPNAPDVLIAVDRTVPTEAEITGLARVMAVFDGADPEAVQDARALWRRAVAAGAHAQYWSQAEGRWARTAEANAP